MIGTEEADFELVPVFRQFMQDVSVDVHYALVKSLSKFFHVCIFLTVLPPNSNRTN